MPEPRRATVDFLRGDAFRRIAALVILSIGAALLVVDYVRAPTQEFQVGEVVERGVRASSTFDYIDWEETLDRQRGAEDAVLPVYDFDATLGGRLQSRVSEAFDHARRRYSEALMGARAEGREELSSEEASAIAADFLRLLELSLDPEDVDRIMEARWSRAVEDTANELIRVGMGGYVASDRGLLPTDARFVSVVRIQSDSRDEVQLEGFEQVRSPAEARQAVSLYALENGDGSDPELRAAVSVARAAVRNNFSYNQLMTEDRRRGAREGVSEVVIRVRRGTTIVRPGDVLTRQQVEMLTALKRNSGGYGMVGVLLALMAFSGLLFLSIYQFAAGYIRKFSTETRDIEAMALLVLLVMAVARLLVEISTPIAGAVDAGLSATAFWLLVPFAGGAMLVRILVNSETAIAWVLASACLLGLLMDQQVLYTLFFVVSGVTGAGAVGYTRERVGVLRAGLLTGLVNGAAALLLNLVQAHLGDAASLAGGGVQPLWDVGFAFAGGIVSSVMVLGMLPMFELFGFVTDYKLLELANLNHPLLRQLMLRAPGTYHHSVTVAQLCESAAESIGANALQTRVACYFHDIGKAVQPKFFIENQRGGPNPHDRLPPRTSARIIINHVVDGEAIARQYKLPQPIIDGITMHHGTGLIQYFYARAIEQAGPDEIVDDADFRYPGQLPSSREAGIMMLADKVEAACRTLRDKSPDSIRALIQKLVNGAVTDGQLVECPLTVKELYTIVEAFTNTLLGIYHHRIDYPGVPQRKNGRPDEPNTGPIITLEMQNPAAVAAEQAAAARESEPMEHTDPDQGPFRVAASDDYESAEHLTGSRRDDTDR